MQDDPKVTTDHLPRYSVRSWGLLHYHLTHLDDDLPEIRPDYRELKQTHAFISDLLEIFKKEEARSDAADLFAFIEGFIPMSSGSRHRMAPLTRYMAAPPVCLVGSCG